jgi:hypothetical protein
LVQFILGRERPIASPFSKGCPALVTGRSQAAIDWPAAILPMGWAVLLALGIGLAFVPAALMQLAAAATARAADRTVPTGTVK